MLSFREFILEDDNAANASQGREKLPVSHPSYNNTTWNRPWWKDPMRYSDSPGKRGPGGPGARWSVRPYNPNRGLAPLIPVAPQRPMATPYDPNTGLTKMGGLRTGAEETGPHYSDPG